MKKRNSDLFAFFTNLSQPGASSVTLVNFFFNIKNLLKFFNSGIQPNVKFLSADCAEKILNLLKTLCYQSLVI